MLVRLYADTRADDDAVVFGSFNHLAKLSPDAVNRLVTARMAGY